MEHRIDIPADAAWILTRLRERGYEGWVVGGCVRDSLLGKAPKDWDICTSARPEELQRIFADCHVIETGLKHGTLTVMLHHEPYEVTTYRIDGDYADHRHPDSVTFVSDVRLDLARRDFTVNAMAYNPEDGLVDAFGGQTDLEAGVIRAVGDPACRFTEDALRIMRALRFAAVYGFSIEPETAAAARALAPTLANVAAERIRVELAKLLCGAGAGPILRNYREIIGLILPEVTAGFDFDQRTPYHAFDVWEHCIRAAENIAPIEVLRLSMLLHDCGKPAVFTVDEEGVGHAYGHGKESARLAAQAAERLKLDKATANRMLTLIEHHDIPLTPALLRRRLHQFGKETVRQLIQVQEADSLAKGTLTDAMVEAWSADLNRALDELLATSPCVTLRDLAVGGREMGALGLRGPAIGHMLNTLLDRVVDEAVPNTAEDLMALARQLIAETTQGGEST